MKARKQEQRLTLFLQNQYKKPRQNQALKRTYFRKIWLLRFSFTTVFLQRHPNIILDWRKLHTNFGGTQLEINANDLSDLSVLMFNLTWTWIYAVPARSQSYLLIYTFSPFLSNPRILHINFSSFITGRSILVFNFVKWVES